MKWRIVGCLLVMLTVGACQRRAGQEVVVYTSVDDVFARPIAERFEKETGVAVQLVPDTEETKSTGVAHRIVAERDHPQADVFWANGE